jgi:hypothetical protein
MTARQKLDEYLRASRRVQDPKPALIAHYEALFEPLRLGIQGYNLQPPELVVTFSPQRRCETIQIGGDAFLIYDEYLGQTMNYLNRVLFNAKNGDAVQAYAMKYIAENLRIRQRPLNASMFALAYGKMRNSAKLGTTTSARERGGMTTLQEVFVIAHEVAHLLYAGSKAFRVDGSDRAQSILLELEENRHRTDTADKLRERYGMTFPEAELIEVEDERIKIVRAHGTRHIEEIACDHWSFRNCLDFADVVLRMPREQSFRAILVTLRHLRALRYFDGLLHFYLTGDGTGFAQSRLAQLREYALRKAMRFTYVYEEDGSSSDWNAIDAEISDLLDRYDNLVEFPLLFDLMDKVKKLRCDELVEPSDEIRASELEVLVDKLTGWAGDGQ